MRLHDWIQKHFFLLLQTRKCKSCAYSCDSNVVHTQKKNLLSYKIKMDFNTYHSALTKEILWFVEADKLFNGFNSLATIDISWKADIFYQLIQSRFASIISSSFSNFFPLSLLQHKTTNFQQPQSLFLNNWMRKYFGVGFFIVNY